MVRIFWSAVAVLVIATAAVFFLPARPAVPAAETRPVAQSGADREADPTNRPTSRPARRDPSAEAAPAGSTTPRATADDSAVGAGNPGVGTGAPPAPGGAVPGASAPSGPDAAVPVPEEQPGAADRQAAPPEPRPAEIVVPTNMPRPEDEGASAGPGEPIASPGAPVPEPLDDALAEAVGDDANDEARPDEAGLDEIVPEEADPAEAPPSDDAPSEEPPTEEGTDAEPTEDGPIDNAVEASSDIGGGSAGVDPQGTQPEASAEVPPAIAVTPRRPEAPPQDDADSAEEPTPAEPVVTTPTGLLLDGRWTVEGKGTKASPYTIEWDMLVAVQRDYQPRLGQTAVPEWIAALDGKIVTIRGYALLPMGMSSMSELLVMLNQWDSCCIGVPPTPYDAIEVRLERDLTPQAQSMFSHTGALSFGDITGTFKVDPYIVQGYLLGLYLMEDASANLLGPAGTP
jgi:hypothetical protein